MAAAIDPGAAASQRGGVLLRLAASKRLHREDVDPPSARGPRLIFVPADVATKVSALSAITKVFGVREPALGIALAEGRVVTVLALGDNAEARCAAARDVRFRPGEDWPVPGSDRAVLCDLDGETVALVGGEV